MTKPRVLCVDDEPELLRSIRLTLRKNFDVTVAESGTAGLQAVRDQSLARVPARFTPSFTG